MRLVGYLKRNLRESYTRSARRILDINITFVVGPRKMTENHRNDRSQELRVAYLSLVCSPAFKCAKRSRDGDF